MLREIQYQRHPGLHRLSFALPLRQQYGVHLSRQINETTGGAKQGKCQAENHALRAIDATTLTKFRAGYTHLYTTIFRGGLGMCSTNPANATQDFADPTEMCFSSIAITGRRTTLLSGKGGETAVDLTGEWFQKRTRCCPMCPIGGLRYA